MAKISRLNDPSVLEAAKPRPRQPSPKTLERQKQYEQFRELMGRLTDPNQVFQVDLDENEKPLTVRLRLLKVAAEARKDIAVRKHGTGFAVGLMTPERRSRRGRRPRVAVPV